MPVGGKNKGRLKNSVTGFQTASGVFGVQQPRACVPHTPYTRCPASVGRILESDGYLRWQWLLSDTSIRQELASFKMQATARWLTDSFKKHILPIYQVQYPI